MLPEHLGISAHYTAIGTGVAQNKILAREVDFAATELPMPPEALELGHLAQVPIAFGALAVAINVEGIADRQLVLTGAVLAAIYGGAIRTWHDPRIVALNPGVALPDLPIQPVFLGQPDGSVFSTSVTLGRYLLASSAEWQAKHGATLPRRWAVGTMVPSSEAMVPILRSRPGSIGYMALGTALSGKLKTVKLRNKDGETVAVSRESLRAAVGSIHWDGRGDMVANLTDLPGPGVWPLVLPSYAIYARTPRDQKVGAAIRTLMNFALVEGTAGVIEASAEPLPPALRRQALAAVANPNPVN